VLRTQHVGLYCTSIYYHRCIKYCYFVHACSRPSGHRQYGMHHVLSVNNCSPIRTGNHTITSSPYGVRRSCISAHGTDDVEEPWLRSSLDTIARYQATAWQLLVPTSELIYKKSSVHHRVYNRLPGSACTCREEYYHGTRLW